MIWLFIGLLVISMWMLIIALCRVAASADYHIDRMEYERWKNESTD